MNTDINVSKRITHDYDVKLSSTLGCQFESCKWRFRIIFFLIHPRIEDKKNLNMNALRNQVTLIGNLGTEVDFKSFESERRRAKISMATNQFYKNKDGELVKETQWHNVIAWGKLADTMNKILKKGDQIMVQGKLIYRNYEKDSGQTQYVTEIIINDFLKITKSTEANAA